MHGWAAGEPVCSHLPSSFRYTCKIRELLRAFLGDAGACRRGLGRHTVCGVTRERHRGGFARGGLIRFGRAAPAQRMREAKEHVA